MILGVNLVLQVLVLSPFEFCYTWPLAIVSFFIVGVEICLLLVCFPNYLVVLPPTLS